MPEIAVDYLVMGAGAAGMAFADSLFTHSDATMVIVDRDDRPGGHWNDAYPFVRLHQPSSSYGVNSEELGAGTIDTVGLNAGFHELASGQEILTHFDNVMQHRFLPSGRVRFFPMSNVTADGMITSQLSGQQQWVDARRFVDATHSRMQVPSTTTPNYAVGADVACVPLNDLPRRAGSLSTPIGRWHNKTSTRSQSRSTELARRTYRWRRSPPHSPAISHRSRPGLGWLPLARWVSASPRWS